MQTNYQKASVGAARGLTAVRLQLFSSHKAKLRARRLLAQYHYVGNVGAVGEQVFYALSDRHGRRLGVLVVLGTSKF